MGWEGSKSHIDGVGSYSRSLRNGLFSGYLFEPRSLKEEDRDRLEGGGAKFKRTLNSLQLICLGIGEYSSTCELCC
jgi:hypothetical protein